MPPARSNKRTWRLGNTEPTVGQNSRLGARGRRHTFFSAGRGRSFYELIPEVINSEGRRETPDLHLLSSFPPEQTGF